ncbi:hypothetical protein DL762_000272 [Monosporascus cannonballus]|uniref:Uncharacterized protein n=1 Tax=Monosporascus cannonballus TaxID=155416 RepID=A0ABY0HJR8_9PEZI|nr:hypothetical protein DL763_008287 [Monosporascus cannonballus]RYO95079.1 hypothetical protein DL762_000272 [Monosporascus cannonballus]
MSSIQEVLDAGEEVQGLREDLERERALDAVVDEEEVARARRETRALNKGLKEVEEDVEEEVGELTAEVEYLEEQASALKDADGKFRLSEYEEMIERLGQARFGAVLHLVMGRERNGTLDRFRNISRGHKEALFNLERQVVEKRLRERIDGISGTLVDSFGQAWEQMDRASMLRMEKEALERDVAAKDALLGSKEDLLREEKGKSSRLEARVTTLEQWLEEKTKSLGAARRQANSVEVDLIREKSLRRQAEVELEHKNWELEASEGELRSRAEELKTERASRELAEADLLSAKQKLESRERLAEAHRAAWLKLEEDRAENRDEWYQERLDLLREHREGIEQLTGAHKERVLELEEEIGRLKNEAERVVARHEEAEKRALGKLAVSRNEVKRLREESSGLSDRLLEALTSADEQKEEILQLRFEVAAAKALFELEEKAHSESRGRYEGILRRERDAKAELSRQLAGAKSELTSAKSQLAEATARVDQVHKTYETNLENSSRVEKDLRARVEAANEKTREEAEAHRRELEGLQAANKKKADEAEAHKKEVNQLRRELETANQKKDEEAGAHQNLVRELRQEVESANKKAEKAGAYKRVVAKLRQKLKATNKKKGKEAEAYKEDVSELRRRLKKLRGLLAEKRKELDDSKGATERQLRTARHNFKLMHERWLGTANRLQGIATGDSRRVAGLLDEVVRRDAVVADKDREIGKRGRQLACLEDILGDGLDELESGWGNDAQAWVPFVTALRGSRLVGGGPVDDQSRAGTIARLWAGADFEPLPASTSESLLGDIVNLYGRALADVWEGETVDRTRLLTSRLDKVERAPVDVVAELLSVLGANLNPQASGLRRLDIQFVLFNAWQMSRVVGSRWPQVQGVSAARSRLDMGLRVLYKDLGDLRDLVSRDAGREFKSIVRGAAEGETEPGDPRVTAILDRNPLKYCAEQDVVLLVMPQAQGSSGVWLPDLRASTVRLVDNSRVYFADDGGYRIRAMGAGEDIVVCVGDGDEDMDWIFDNLNPPCVAFENL